MLMATMTAARLVDDPELTQLGSNYKAFIKWQKTWSVRWLDLLAMFPSLIGRIPPGVFYQVAPTIRPRFYSISSSSYDREGHVAITVSAQPFVPSSPLLAPPLHFSLLHCLIGSPLANPPQVAQLSYKLQNNEVRLGYCSSYLNGVQPGAPVDFKIMPTPGFRLPLDLRTSVVMIAAGSGMAPMRVGPLACHLWPEISPPGHAPAADSGVPFNWLPGSPFGRS